MGHWPWLQPLHITRWTGLRRTADSIAFSAGVYDTKTRAYPANLKALLADAASAYRSYLLGTVEFNPDRDIWVAPAGNKSVKAIYVERIFLVPAR